MKLLASKFNEKNFFLRSQLYAWAYVRIWTLRPCLWYMYVILFTCRFSFLTMYMTVSPVFALRKIDCLTFQSAYPEHLVKSVIAFVYPALEETEEIAPGCRTGEIGHECH